MASGKVYAVRKGQVPGIYMSWEDAKVQVEGFSNSEHKSFRVSEEAETWLRGGLSKGDAGLNPCSGSSSQFAHLTRQLQHLHVSSGGLLGGANSSPSTTLGGLNAASQNHARMFVYVEDMELMLLRACSFSHIGNPIFVRQDSTGSGGSVMFWFTVVLPCNCKGLDLVAHGPVSSDEHLAQQDVSFIMLEKLLSAMGYKIMDFNYRQMSCMQEDKDSWTRNKVESLRQRIESLEARNVDLRSQFALIHDMYDSNLESGRDIHG